MCKSEAIYGCKVRQGTQQELSQVFSELRPITPIYFRALIPPMEHKIKSFCLQLIEWMKNKFENIQEKQIFIVPGTVFEMYHHNVFSILRKVSV